MIEKSVSYSNSLSKDRKLLPARTPNKFSRILIIAIIFNVILAGATFVLLQVLSPTYRSRGAAIIPGVGSQGSVDLTETTSESANTPYSYLLKVDPRENYRYIALTDDVIAKAASAVNMNIEEFGVPDIGLDKNSSIIEFEVTGKTREEAQQKAQAFYQAWDERISLLRQKQAEVQNQGIERELENINRRLEATQKKISDFRSQSPLNISTQIDVLAERIEDLRIEQAKISERKNGADTRVGQLSSLLKLTPAQAGDALILLDDKTFQNSLKNYSEAVSQLEILSSNWSADSPQVSNQKDKKQEAQNAMLQRSRILLGKPVDTQFLSQLNIEEGGRLDLVQELVRLQTEREALATQNQTKQQQIEEFESRLKTLNQEKFVLSRLERDAQISESIFTGGIAKLDVNKPEYATNYPPLQLIKEPSYPFEENGSKRTIILGALAISFLSTTILITVWWEKSQRELNSWEKSNREFNSWEKSDPWEKSDRDNSLEARPKESVLEGSKKSILEGSEE